MVQLILKRKNIFLGMTILYFIALVCIFYAVMLNFTEIYIFYWSRLIFTLCTSCLARNFIFYKINLLRTIFLLQKIVSQVGMHTLVLVSLTETQRLRTSVLCLIYEMNKQTNKQTNNNDLLEKDGGTKNCIYKD